VSTIKGAKIAVARGQMVPVAGWTFTGFETSQDSIEIIINGGRAFTTTLTVSEISASVPAQFRPSSVRLAGIPSQNLPD
jgi:hypothetical protein